MHLLHTKCSTIVFTTVCRLLLWLSIYARDHALTFCHLILNTPYLSGQCHLSSSWNVKLEKAIFVVSSESYLVKNEISPNSTSYECWKLCYWFKNAWIHWNKRAPGYIARFHATLAAGFTRLSLPFFSYQSKTVSTFCTSDKTITVFHLNFCQWNRRILGKTCPRYVCTIVCQKLLEWHVIKIATLFGTPRSRFLFLHGPSHLLALFLLNSWKGAWGVRIIDRIRDRKVTMAPGNQLWLEAEWFLAAPTPTAGKISASNFKVLQPGRFCTASTRILNPESISVPAQTPARCPFCQHHLT